MKNTEKKSGKITNKNADKKSKSQPNEAEPGSTAHQAILPKDDHAQHALDEALWESFPSSDPVAVSVAKSAVPSRPAARTRKKKDRS